MRVKQDLPLSLLFRLDIRFIQAVFPIIVGRIFMVTQVKVGDKAPDFTLPDIDMKPRA